MTEYFRSWNGEAQLCVVAGPGCGHSFYCGTHLPVVSHQFLSHLLFVEFLLLTISTSQSIEKCNQNSAGTFDLNTEVFLCLKEGNHKVL